MASRSDMEDLLKHPSELGKDECAIALRKALVRSAKFRTIREVSEAARVNYNTTKDYVQGRHLASRENWARIAAVFLAEIGARIPVRRKRAFSCWWIRKQGPSRRSGTSPHRRSLTAWPRRTAGSTWPARTVPWFACNNDPGGAGRA